MDNGRKNYQQEWGNEIARQYRRAWNGDLAFADFGQLFAPSLVFHFQDAEVRGAADFQSFIQEARRATRNLDLLQEVALTDGDMVLLYFRWTSQRWHSDIVSGNPRSNYCKVVLRVEDGRIAELWQQAPDFLYLLGKRPQHGVMRYPQVVAEGLLIEEDGGIYPTDDAQTKQMSDLFKRMNDCFLNRASLRNMKDIQNDDIVYDTGGTRGSGVQSWKTFAYALHTCLGTQKGTRLDDLYIRKGERLRVFLRASTGPPSAYILQCAEGLVASLKMTARDGKIQVLETQLENYIQFLDTDFSRHPIRLKNLFHGQREPVLEAAEGDHTLRAAPGTGAAHPSDATAAAGLDRVAIVGMAGRFPQCDSVGAYWDALVSQRPLISEIPEQRAYLRQGTDIAHAGFIDDVDLFDAAFFQMLPSEAEFVDPQQRLLFEEIVHSIEDSGHASADFAGPRTGLFVATLCEDYAKLLQDQGLINHPQTWAGNENAMFPAKVARFLNIQGPCHFINAECTSSLVALHEASRLIREGAIDQAIVGATNLLLHRYGFVVRSGALLTDEPLARLFSRHSRGQLRGEAIVSVVLKSLSKALADGDHVYGIVAGSALNNSGRTLSLVAGNVEQQARAMTEAWRAARVGPEQVSLIQCHASGVRGGDFAEFAAIKQAFAAGKGESAERPRCRISTVKGAIGHAEAASGLTSLVTVLLQLRHRQIVGICGLDQPDPELRSDATRFDFVKDTVAWDAPLHEGARQPRIAGINGFAAGGYNAHVVIEEYLHDTEAPATADTRAAGEAAAPGSSVVVLSAQSESSLGARLRDMRRHLEAHPSIDLADLAHTLQRRDAMKHRAAFVVERTAELLPLIDAVLAGGPLPANVFVGRKGRSGGGASELQDTQGPLECPELARRWSEGQAVPWARIAPSAGRRMVRDLPLYPFDKKRYWVPESASVAAVDATNCIHPLLHRNVSTVFRQRYRSVFTGSEPWLADHVVQGRKLLPGMAYVEMVRAAVHDALQTETQSPSGRDDLLSLQLRNVVWLQPIAIDPSQPRSIEVQVDLIPIPQTGAQTAQQGSTSSPAATPLAFEVSTVEDGQRRLHCQGQASVRLGTALPRVDLVALRAACDATQMAAAQVYAAYAAIGIEYGPSYRAVTSLHGGQDAAGARQVLAELALPLPAQLHDGTVLHPSMMDAAVHAAIGLVIDAQAQPGQRKPPLPFALESVDVLHPCADRMWAWIRFSRGADGQSSAADESGSALVQKLDIDLVDATGTVCVRMQRFSSRTGEKEPRKQPLEMPRMEPAPDANVDELYDRLVTTLKDKVAAILHVPAEDVDPDEELNQYGFDSINLTEFGNQLNELFHLPAQRPLNPTIFFEHPTLASFSRYLLEQYRDAIAATYAAVRAAPPAPQDADDAGAAPAARHARTLRSAGATEAIAVAPADAAVDIAIVGISGRFPMADDVDEFWHNLVAGRDCITEVPRERWDWRSLYGNPFKEPYKTDVKWGGFIDGVGDFDPLFFGISPREAELMDPQQRLLMQHVWQAIEDAGYDPHGLSGSRTGVFLGTACSGYTGLLAQANNPIEGSTITGMVPSVGPNRISYFLNLRGPSEPIETACSSSLVAIHRAIVAIQAGTCDMALVGGVNTVVTPEGHIGFRKAGMLCEDGRCKTFSSQANGYVRGEGVGILFLKKLADAERSADHVYAVIKGSAENHGGRANSLTAPNPKAQAELIRAAHTQAGIDPRSVGYVEAHGTGTALGDPIEINALKSAFAELYAASGDALVTEAHCGLGSVKSNIGHLELAAGVAGVIKVLLQLEHKTLVKSLHSEQINPYIQLQGCPFYVVQQNQAWNAVTDRQGRELPRRAGVSAFGFGGANAHVVLEEHRGATQDEAAHDPAPCGPCVVVLSARTTKQLQESAQRLLKALGDPQRRGRAFCDDDLRDIAYTLQVGRHAMEERLGLVVHSLAELRAKLQTVVDGGERIADVYRGSEKPNRDAIAIFHGDVDLQDAISAWMVKGKYKKVLELWVKGLSVDWEKLHAAASPRPRRVSLPAYPFARDRYWVPATASPAVAPDAAPGAALHPLVQRNTSDFSRQRYSATFSGQEFFLRDHVVLQHRVLPAVAYLEMARAALMNAVGGKGASAGIRLRNVVWAQPILFDDNSAISAAASVHIGLALDDAGDIAFQIYTNPVDEGNGAQTAASTLHCQGMASLRSGAAAGALDIEALHARCADSLMSREQVYAAFEALGLQYGPSHRALQELRIGEAAGGDVEVLAKLELPAALLQTLGDYVLHPSLLDAALQAGIGFMLHGNPAAGASRPPLPFHLKELEILAPCTASMWAWARRAPADAAAANRAAQALDIDLCDAAGNMCVRIRGFASRVLPDKQAPGPAGEASRLAPAAPAELAVDKPHSLMLAPVWESIGGLLQLQDATALQPAASDSVLVIAGAATAVAAIRQLYPQATIVGDLPADADPAWRAVDHVVWVAPDAPLASLAQDRVIEDQESGVLQLFRVIKALLAVGRGSRPLGLTFVTSQAQAVHDGETLDPTHAGVIGLAGSLAKEYPAWKVRAVDLPLGWSARLNAAGELTLREVFSLPASAAGSAWVCRDAQWYQQKLAPLQLLDRGPGDRARDSSYKSQGVYVVIGGAGGIGEVWSEYMIRTHQARIVWIGRREPDDAIQAKLDRLAALGPRPWYIRADATQRASLQAAYGAIRNEFARIDGVVHSAIVLQDRSLANMDESEFRAALAAKVDVSVRMAQVFQSEPLDFVMFFSSLVAFARPPGQSNYVAGCTFKDAFAQRLALDWPCAVKVMNWGYWGGVGVAASEQHRQRMAQLGIGSIEPAEAMEALEILLRDPLNQTALVNVTKPLAELSRGIYSFLAGPGSELPAETAVAPPQPSEAAVHGTAKVEDHVTQTIKKVLADALKVDIGSLDLDEPFTGYGLDSITGVHLAQTLNEAFGVELDVTLFFDHSTVRLLAGHLLREHAGAIARSAGGADGGAPAERSVPGAAPEPAAPVVPRPAHRFMPEAGREARVRNIEQPAHDDGVAADGIAIVGLSGRFPGAADSEELWRNQVAGKDCVSEVPEQRWDWRQVTGDPTQAVDRSCFKWGGFIDGVDQFDAAFFGITPQEATYMSPQQRLLLTYVWKALEDAAIAPKDLSKDPTGVFIATVPSEYLNTVSDPKDVPLMVTGLATSMIPNRISHSLNLRGPSEHVDTACSSTLVALHRAVQAIRNGECRQAIVGAVNLLLTPAGYIGFESMGYLSPAGKMAAFQAEANGFVRAEGVGALILKPLRKAIEDRDHIHAVIRGTGVAHGGHAVSMTTPNATGMKEAIRQAYESSGIDPRTVAYIEAHGIASPLGDAIEINALKSEYQRLTAAFGDSIPNQSVCHIGSAKPCTGYAEVASGMIAVIKVVMAMRHRILPGIARFTKVHDNISLNNCAFRITADNQPWTAITDAGGSELPRRAAINNYGFSGVNAHLVLEEYVPAPGAARSDAPALHAGRQLIVLSARTAVGLRKSARQMLDFVRAHEDASLVDIAYTLQKGREPMEHRLAVVVGDRDGLVHALLRCVDAGADGLTSLDGASVHVGVADRGSAGKADATSMEHWLEEGCLDELASHWVHGGDVPWQRLPLPGHPRSLPLPGHPQEPTRYWVHGGTGLSALHSHGPKPAKRARRTGATSRAMR